MQSRAFDVFCAAYFCANLVLRWAAFEFFGGYGAYGWARPGPLGLAAMAAALVASTLIVFVVLPWLVERAAALAGLPPRAVQRALAASAVAAICYAEVDSIWFALSKEHLRGSDILIFLESDPTAHFGVSLRQVAGMLLSVLIHVPILVAAWWAIGRVWRPGAAVPPRRWPRAAAAAGLLAIVGGTAAGHLLVNRQSDQWAAIARKNLYDVSAARFVRYRHPDADALQGLLRERTDAAPAGTPAPPRAAAPAAFQHILIIAVEGWNPRHFDPQVMPFLAALSRRFMTFPAHFSSGNNTLLGITGLVFGQTPALFFEQRAQGVHNAALRRLIDAGWAPARFGHGLTSYRSIEGYLSDLPEGPDAHGGTPAQSFRRIREHIAGHERTLSLYYYADTHFPYEHSPRHSQFQPESESKDTLMAGVTPREIQAIVNRYRNTLAQADAQLRTLFESLDWEKMLVVVTGDHGESMMENGRLSHSSSLETPQIGTPMMLYHPGVDPKAFAGVSSHLDVMPTVLALAGVAPVDSLHGVSLLDAGPTRRALVAHNNQNSRPTRLAAVADRHKIVFDFSDPGAVAVVDLLTRDDQPVRLQSLDRDSVVRSLDFVVGILRASGCLPGSAAAAALPLRHCRNAG